MEKLEVKKKLEEMVAHLTESKLLSKCLKLATTGGKTVLFLNHPGTHKTLLEVRYESGYKEEPILPPQERISVLYQESVMHQDNEEYGMVLEALSTGQMPREIVTGLRSQPVVQIDEK